MSAEDESCGHGTCGCQSGPSTPGEAGSSLIDKLDNDVGFHPMGDDWETEMREMLEDTDFDADLGMEMARDAMRLTAGELSEEEFYEQYNDAVIEEFGEDDRPMAEQFEFDGPSEGSILDSLKDLAEGDVSRRDTMKKGAFAAGAMGLGGLLPSTRQEDEDDSPSASGTAAAQPDEGDGVRYGMVIDADRCDGCLECVVGCMDENGQDRGANWMYVFTWHDENTDEDNFLTRPCQHCSNAPCAKVCPVQARHIRDRDGLVLTDYETCIGCRYCQVACPYGVNYFQWGHPEVPRDELMQGDHGMDASELQALPQDEREEVLQDSGDHIHDYRGREVDSRGRIGTMGKCTFCPSRQDGNMGEEMVGTVACQDACDTAGMNAIHFGDLNDPDSRPNRYLEARKEMAVNPNEQQEGVIDEDDEELWAQSAHPEDQISAFRLLEEMNTQPNIIYLGNEPGPNAEQVDGPVPYDLLRTADGREVVDRRKDVTDEETIGVF